MPHNRKVTKAVITAAGYGTRFLPITKAIQKEMLPIIDKPILHYIVEECVMSGIKDIIIVTKYGTSSSVEDYFDSIIEYEEFLRKSRKYKELDQLKWITKMANIAYVRQNKELPYGNASPLIAAKNFIGKESFVLAWGDDIVLSKVPAVKQVKLAYERNKCSAVLAVQEVSNEEIQRIGMVSLKKGSKNQVEGVLEKPEKHQITSNLAEYGRFVLSPVIFKFLSVDKKGKGNELWLIDAINEMCKKHKVIAQPIDGKWYTTGDPLRYLKTTFAVAMRRDDIKEDLIAYLREEIKAIDTMKTIKD